LVASYGKEGKRREREETTPFGCFLPSKGKKQPKEKERGPSYGGKKFKNLFF